MNRLQCLIISSSIDYSTDLVCIQLEKQHVPYLRINRDQFEKFQIRLDINKCVLEIEINYKVYTFKNNTENSIYFRAPTFLRTLNKKYSLDEQVYKSQWNAFIRNLIIFDNVKWINNPVNTYRAENKMFQLSKAMEMGLLIPDTKVVNCVKNIKPEKEYVIKSIDTALFNENDVEMFVYSNVLSGKKIQESELALAPVFIQEYLNKKTDIRVTYIAGKTYPVKILADGNRIECDWRRKKKDSLSYVECEIPEDVNRKIIKLMNYFKLEFGGIDLIERNGMYYFLEVNPTGEWGWIQSNTKVAIDQEIVQALMRGKSEK